jgi:hypothetical protein
VLLDGQYVDIKDILTRSLVAADKAEAERNRPAPPIPDITGIR